MTSSENAYTGVRRVTCYVLASNNGVALTSFFMSDYNNHGTLADSVFGYRSKHSDSAVNEITSDGGCANWKTTYLS